MKICANGNQKTSYRQAIREGKLSLCEYHLFGKVSVNVDSMQNEYNKQLFLTPFTCTKNL